MVCFVFVFFNSNTECCHSTWNPLSSPTWAEELASSCTDSGPQVGRELLLVLVLQNELGDGSLPQRAGSSHGSHTAFLLHQLAVNQGHQLPLHGSTQYALRRAAQAHTWRDVRHRQVVKTTAEWKILFHTHIETFSVFFQYLWCC